MWDARTFITLCITHKLVQNTLYSSSTLLYHSTTQISPWKLLLGHCWRPILRSFISNSATKKIACPTLQFFCLCKSLGVYSYLFGLNVFQSSASVLFTGQSPLFLNVSARFFVNSSPVSSSAELVLRYFCLSDFPLVVFPALKILCSLWSHKFKEQFYYKTNLFSFQYFRIQKTLCTEVLF